MNIVLLVITVIMLLLIMLIWRKKHIVMEAKVDDNGVSLDIDWLRPFIRVKMQIENLTVMICVYVFQIRVYHRPVKKQRTDKPSTGWLGIIDLSDIEITARYGLRYPSSTAILYGMAAFILNGLPVPVKRLTQQPNFVAQQEYIYISVHAYLNLRQTISNYFKNKKLNQ